MKIEGRSIIYPDHKVTLIGEFDEDFAKECIADMAQTLTLDGGPRDHNEELDMMNNDGSWIIEF